MRGEVNWKTTDTDEVDEMILEVTYLLLVRRCMFIYTALLAHQRDVDVSHQVDQLRQCISILFAFQRRPSKDSVFVTDSHQWLSRLVRLFLIFLLSFALQHMSLTLDKPLTPRISDGHARFDVSATNE